ncbi:MAG: nucleotide-binding protein [Candidatus Bathyarchaeota archaeon]|nr:MAG: nucleotide-binding protein [Candidatus Bathyarchaeota archaeon]
MATAVMSQELQAVRIKKREQPQIFIAHTLMSKKLLEKIIRIIKNEHVTPFIANQETNEKNPVERISQAINNSEAFFSVLTKNTLKRQSIRDWIFFEIGLAKGIWKKTSKFTHRYEIFVWKDIQIKLPYNNPIKVIADSKSINTRSKKSTDMMLEEMKAIARNISIVHKII